MAKGRMLSKNVSISQKIKWAVIIESKARCSHCGKQGIVAFHKEKPAVLEKFPYKFCIDVIDGNFIYKHRSMELDHIIPESRGGPTTVENLQILCKQCNLRKGRKLIPKEPGRS